jgi:hypothetical protein
MENKIARLRSYLYHFFLKKRKTRDISIMAQAPSYHPTLSFIYSNGSITLSCSWHQEYMYGI